MARRFERYGLAFLLAFLSVLGGLQETVTAQGSNVDLPTAVKEAQQAGVPTVTINQLLSLGYANQLESSVIVSYIKVLTEIQREKLPIEPFVGKIEEGVAKRVSSQGIHRALMKKREDYRFTQSVIGETLKKHGKDPTIPVEDFIRLAETLSCGISKENLRFYVEHGLPSSSYRSLAAILDTVAILEQNRFDSDLTKKIALAAMEKNYLSRERKDFPHIIVAAKKKGIPDASITSLALEAIQKNSSPKAMALRLGVTANDLARGPIVDQERSRVGKKDEVEPGRVGEPTTHGLGGSDRGEQGGSQVGHGESGSEGDRGSGGEPGGGDSGGGGHGGGHGGGGKK